MTYWPANFIAWTRAAISRLCWGACALWIGLSNAAAQSPYVTTQLDPWVVGYSATLHGMVTPRGLSTTAWFEWGATTNYGFQSEPVDVGSGSSVVLVTNELTGLVPPVNCHYRLVASNSAGINYGADQMVSFGKRVWAGTNTPSGLSNVVAIAMGGSGLDSVGPVSISYNQIALKSDGQPVTWQIRGTRTQSTNWTFTSTNLPVPQSVSNVISVATGGHGYDFLSLKQDGSVEAWGFKSDMLTNYPQGLTNVIAIAVGESHAMTLRRDGTVATWWRRSTYGTNFPTVPENLSNIVAIAAGYNFCLALKDDGSVISWGAEDTVPSNATNVVALAAGNYNNSGMVLRGPDYAPSYFLRKDHSVIANTYLINLENTNNTGLLAGTNIALISAGGYAFDTADKSAALWPLIRATNTTPSPVSNITAIASIGYHTMCLAANGAPTATGQRASVYLNVGTVIRLAGWDPNGDLLTARILSLPTLGALYQCDDGRRGALIDTTNALVTDSINRVYYVPPTNQWSVSDSFQFIVNDGDADSSSANVNIYVIGGMPQIYMYMPWVRSMTGSNVVLDAWVVPNGSPAYACFQWGTSTNRELWTNSELFPIGGTSSSVPIETRIGSLQPMTRYYFDILATNPVGAVNSTVGSFVTPVDMRDFTVKQDHVFRARFYGGANSNLTMWASTDLTNWVQMPPLINVGNGQLEFQDSDTTNRPARFYQLRSP